ncbi:cAMP-dependent protein kinase catalytic subunit beta-like isoform X3 [Homalodisca vitripennis]|uniref:cAMP-dependent protein kinase catalytic subunit beta-like isoform X3 n=1 Tax=Homalodisca vitripennis TaxID=197043 RepID=UPI001EEA97D1|nr:cAMP-dependent protein kinase catalytic subunit beta-like isoform X3 [Homalodisca vitripennis]
MESGSPSKVSHKYNISKRKMAKIVLCEKRLLQSLDFPFTIRMEHYSQDPYNIYFVMPFVVGGEMFTHLRNRKCFDDDLTRFYAAQMVLALEYLSCVCVVHRDIKPENILLDQHGFLKLADFGFSKIIEGRTYTFCGTPPYIAPEVVRGQGYGRSADWWSLGILIFEMAAGSPPWVTRNNTKLFLKIMYDQLRFPRNFSLDLQDLLKKLLQRDVTRRIGNTWKGAAAVKEHAWFKKVNWLKMLNRSTNPPFVPPNTGHGDVSNFPHAAKSAISKMTKAHAPTGDVDITAFADDFKDF